MLTHDGYSYLSLCLYHVPGCDFGLVSLCLVFHVLMMLLVDTLEMRRRRRPAARAPAASSQPAAARPLANGPPYAAKIVSLWPLRSLFCPFHRGDMVAFGLSLACRMGLLSAVILDHFSASGDHYSALQTRSRNRCSPTGASGLARVGRRYHMQHPPLGGAWGLCGLSCL